MGSIEIFISALTFTPYCKAVVLETFGPDYWFTGPFTAYTGYGIENYTKFHNVLHIWPLYEEFEMTDRDSTATWIAKGLDAIDSGYNLTVPPNFDTTYNLTAGGWNDGSMRRHALIPTDHPGLTVNSQAIAESVAWFSQALQGKSEQAAWVLANPTNQIWMYSEGFGLIATLFLIMSILPLGVLLIKVKFFKEVEHPIPDKVTIRKKSTWWIFAVIATAFGAITFETFTYWLPAGFGGTILPPILTPIFNIGIASTLAVWSLVIVSITAILFAIWYLVVWFKQRRDISFYDMGVSYATKEEKDGLSFVKRLARSSEPRIIGKTILILLILLGWMYLWVFLAEVFLKVPFRGVWSILTTFTFERFIRFWVYLIPTLLFFLIVGGLFLFGELKMDKKESGIKTQVIWWIKTSFVLVGGLIVVFLLQYGTVVLGMGFFFNNPDILNYYQHYPLMELLLFMQIPLYIVLTFVLVFFYRKTGKIYLGAIICAFIATWILVTSSCIYI